MSENLTQAKRRKSYWWLAYIVLAAIVMFVIGHIYYKLTGDFRLTHITYEWPYHTEWETLPLPSEDQAALSKILDQKFSFIDKGNQSYVFASEDQKYVLKFFKFRHIKPNWLLDLLPPFSPFIRYKENRDRSKKKRLEKVFIGYKNAFEIDRDNSGLVFIHLNQTGNLHKRVVIKDGLGLKHTVDLDLHAFIIQKKAKTTQSVLIKLLAQGEIGTAKQRLRQLIDMCVIEYERGLLDCDHNIMVNTGFAENEPIRIDVGKLICDEQIKNRETYLKDLEKIVFKRIDPWLNKYYSQYRSELFQDLQSKLNEIQLSMNGAP